MKLLPDVRLFAVFGHPLREYRSVKRIVGFDDEGTPLVVGGLKHVRTRHGRTPELKQGDQYLRPASLYADYLGIIEEGNLKEDEYAAITYLPCPPGWTALYAWPDDETDDGPHPQYTVEVRPVIAWACRGHALHPVCSGLEGDKHSVCEQDADAHVGVWGPGEPVPAAEDLDQLVKSRLSEVRERYKRRRECFDKTYAKSKEIATYLGLSDPTQ